jgi:hypothetical protein
LQFGHDACRDRQCRAEPVHWTFDLVRVIDHCVIRSPCVMAANRS